MKAQELRKLRDVVCGRLARGDDVEALRAQLAVRLGDEDAGRVIAAAQLHLEGDEDQAEASISAVSARAARKERYWTGDIATREHAERIARTTAGWFGGFGGVYLLSALASGRLDPSALLTGLIALIFPAWLWKAKSTIAASVLLVVSGLSCIASLAFGVVSLITGDAFVVPMLSLAVVWFIPMMAAFRAFTATRFLRRAPTPSAVVETFD